MFRNLPPSNCWRKPQVTIVRGTIIIFAAAMVLSSSAAVLARTPKFVMEQSDDRFSTNGVTTWSSRDNRISKQSIGGGRHIDDKGVFLEPFAILEQGDARIRALGFFFRNFYTRSTLTGASLAFGLPERVTFLTGEGTPMAIDIKSTKVLRPERPYCEQVTNNCFSDETETGVMDLTLAQYIRIMNSSALVVRVEGEKRQWVYETKQIDPAFIQNLRTFYEAHLASDGRAQ